MAGERLVFDIFAIDHASQGFIAAGRSASAAADNVAGLARRLDEIGTKSVEARVGLKGNKEALSQLDQLQFRLLKLGETTSSPDISLEGYAKASAQISALELQMDRLSKKIATPEVRLSFLERQFADTRGIGGIPFLGRLFRGGAGAGVGLPGVLGKIGGIGPIPPVGELPPAAVIGGLAAALAALPFLAQAAAGAITLTLGGGLAALGVAGALGTGKTVTPGMITAAQDRLKAAQLRHIAAQDKLNQLTATGTTNAGKLATAQAAVASSSGAIATAQGSLNKLLNDAQSPAQLATRKAFANLSNDAQTSLAQIGKSFQPVMLSIFNTADSVLGKLTPVFSAAVKVISGPFQLVANTLIKSLASPQVKTAITTLGTAFAGLLKAFAPSIPGIVTSIADGLTNIFRAVARNPKAFADMAAGLFHLVGILLDVLGGLTNIATYVEKHWKPAMLGLAGPILDHWRGLATFFTKTLPDAFKGVIITALSAAGGIASAFGHLPGPLGAPFRAAHDAIAAELARIEGRASTAVTNIRNYWLGLNGLTANLLLNVASSVPVVTGGRGQAHVRVPGQAAGTSFAAPGWAWVGERGPELAYFRGGETVLPAHVARGYAGGTGGGRTEALLEQIAVRLDELCGLAAQGNGIAAQAPAIMGAAMAGGARASLYSSLYP